MRPLRVNLSAADIDDRGASSHDIEPFCRKGHLVALAGRGRSGRQRLAPSQRHNSGDARVAYHLT
jgi:hypothetical protein